MAAADGLGAPVAQKPVRERDALAGHVALPDGGRRCRAEDPRVEQLLDGHRHERRRVGEQVPVARDSSATSVLPAGWTTT